MQPQCDERPWSLRRGGAARAREGVRGWLVAVGLSVAAGLLSCLMQVIVPLALVYVVDRVALARLAPGLR